MGLVGPRRVTKAQQGRVEPVSSTLNLAWDIFGAGTYLPIRRDFRTLNPGRPKIVTAAIANIELLEVS